jgi:homogentisate 1,2-dioxygenase
MGIYIYTANADMLDTAFYNSDGDFLIGTGRHLSCALLLPPMSWRLARVA